VPNNNAESEADADEDSPMGEKKPKADKLPSSISTSIYAMEGNDEAHFEQDNHRVVGSSGGPAYMMSNDSSRSSGSSGHLSFYENILSNPSKYFFFTFVNLYCFMERGQRERKKKRTYIFLLSLIPNKLFLTCVRVFV
jgi:hypothetical protein